MTALIDLPLIDTTFVEGPELLTNGDFSAWTGVYPAEHPTGWTVTSADTAANHLAQDPAGKCRIVSDGTYVGCAQTIAAVGGNYRSRITVSTVTLDSINLSVITSPAYNMATTGDKVFDCVAAGAQFALARRSPGVPADVTIDSASCRALLVSTNNVGSLLGTCQLGDGISTTTYPTLIGNGKRGMVFDGAANYLNICPALPFGTTNSYTISATYFTSNGNNQIICGDASTWNANEKGFCVYLWGGNIYGYIGDGTNNRNVVVAGNFKNQLLKVTFIITRISAAAASADLYVNGNLIGSTASGLLNDATSTKRLYVGKLDSTAAWLAGKLYDFKVFPYALTPSQIRSLNERSKWEINL